MAKPPRQSGRRATFTPEAAGRIAKVVRDAERGQGDISPTAPRVTGLDGEVIRGTFTAPWAKDATKTVTDATLSSVTYEAKNYFSTLTGSGTKRCAITFTAGEWILIAAECS